VAEATEKLLVKEMVIMAPQILEAAVVVVAVSQRPAMAAQAALALSLSAT
jgi:hypothetical protein